MKRFDFVAIAEGEQPGLRTGSLIEGKDECAIEAGGVVGAGGVAEVMIEVGNARTSTQEVHQAFMRGGMGDALLARTRRSLCDAAIRERDGAAIGQLQMIFKQAAIESQAGDFGGIVEAIEFFFLDGEDNAMFVQKCDGRTVAE